MVQIQLTCVVGIACFISEVFSCSNDSLVNGPNGVDDSSMTSSRYWALPGTIICFAHLGRLNMQPYYADDGTEYSAWCAPTNTLTDYLQVEFASLKTMIAVLTQGKTRPDFLVYTKSYLVRYSNDGNVWTDILENNSPKVFPGNFDGETVVTNYLPSPVTAKFVRIVPQSWESSVCLRIDILGCDASAVEPVAVNSSRNGTLWGYAGVANGSVSIMNTTMNTTTKSNLECVTTCSITDQCLIVSFEPATYKCIGYGTTNIIGYFTPSIPSVMSPDVYNTLYFNYDYAEGLGFTSLLSSGLSYKLSNTRKTQADAQTDCQSLNAMLISFTYTSQINGLLSAISESPSHVNEAGLFVAGFYDGSKYLDSTGVEILTTFWASSQPDVNDQCVVLTPQGQLSTRNCADTLYFICSLL